MDESPLLGSHVSASARRSIMRRQKSTSTQRTRFDLVDHFSLRSSLFRYKNKVVLNGVRHQLIFELEQNDLMEDGLEQVPRIGTSALEDNGKERRVLISVKRASVYGGGIFMLKFLYSYVAMFLFGVAAVFSVLVFLQYGIGVVLVGLRSESLIDEKLFTALSLLALPSFVDALSILITFCVGFLNDIWNDFEFMNTASAINPVVRDWIHVLFAALIPLGTFTISLFVKADSPFTNTLLSALISMFSLFIFCVLYTLLLEVYSSVRIIRSVMPEVTSTRKALWELFLIRVRYSFALYECPKVDQTWMNHMAAGEDPEEAMQARLELENKLGPIQSIFYENVPVRRIYTLENVLRPRPVMSRRDGSILFLCCLSRSRFLGVIPQAAMWSSFICILFTTLLVWLVFVGYLLYSTYVSDLTVVLLSIGSFFIASFVIWRSYADVIKFKKTNKGIAKHLHQVERRARLQSSTSVGDDGANASAHHDNGNGAGREHRLSDHNLEEDLESISSVPTPQLLDLSVFNEAANISARKYVYALPKLPGAFFLISLNFFIRVFVPACSFFYLEVGGYGMFFLLCCLITTSRSLFNVPILIQIFGAEALETLDLPFMDEFYEENISQHPDDENSQDGVGEDHENGIHDTDQREQQRRAEIHASSSGILGTLWSPLRQLESAKTSSGGRRIYLLLTRMTKVTIRNVFIYLFGFCSIMIVALVAFSVDLDTTHSNYKGPTFIGNSSHLTHHVPKKSKMEIGFQYPICDLLDDYVDFGKSILPFIPPRHKKVLNALDLAFLSDLAYSSQETTQSVLDAWFPSGVAPEYIPPHRYPEIATKRQSAVVFKVFKFNARDSLLQEKITMFVVSIRGTLNSMDLLSDLQMWFPAMLFQVLRFALPFGSVWDSVVPSLIHFMSMLDTTQHKGNPVTFDTDIRRFISALKKKNPKSHVLLTGHSLGGGLAILAGASEHVPAIAFSAPNAMLSHLKFQIQKQDLDRYTINVIPSGDPVPLIDEQALLTESVLCRTSRGEPLGVCHEISRTVCELQFVCGSGNRPPLAICNETYKYPAPVPKPKFSLDWPWDSETN